MPTENMANVRIINFPNRIFNIFAQAEKTKNFYSKYIYQSFVIPNYVNFVE